MNGVSVEVGGVTTRVETRIASSGAIQERSSPGYERLKPGPGRPPEQVRANQRARIHHAMVEIAADVGYEHVTVRSLTRAAGVSSRTFYLHFSNREDCLASAIDSLGRRLLRRAACRNSDGLEWQDRMRAMLASLLEDFAEQPKVARLLLVESVAAGRPGRTSASELTSGLERLLAHVLGRAPVAPTPPYRMVVGIAAGVARVATLTTLTGRASELPALAHQLGDWVLQVYNERAVSLCRPPRRPGRGGRREPQPFPAELSVLSGLGEGERILAAAARLAGERGPAALTASKIRREAGVSRRSFDARFLDPADCFLAAVESLARTATVKAEAWADACGGGGPHTGRTLLALCAMAARNQTQARLVLVGILAPGRIGHARREQLISDASERLMKRKTRSASSGSPLGLEASVAATWRIAQREVVAGRADRLPELAPLLSSFVTSSG